MSSLTEKKRENRLKTVSNTEYLLTVKSKMSSYFTEFIRFFTIKRKKIILVLHYEPVKYSVFYFLQNYRKKNRLLPLLFFKNLNNMIVYVYSFFYL
jgi:hypothetical protein